jgi:hypothetical protein
VPVLSGYDLSLGFQQVLQGCTIGFILSLKHAVYDWLAQLEKAACVRI